jgi:hypothetical protein
VVRVPAWFRKERLIRAMVGMPSPRNTYTKNGVIARVGPTPRRSRFFHGRPLERDVTDPGAFAPGSVTSGVTLDISERAEFFY